MKLSSFILLLLLGCYAYAQPPNSKRAYSIQGYAQGTTYSIKYYSTHEIFKREIDSVLAEIDTSLSIYLPSSRISMFNSFDCNRMVMDKHLKAVITESFKTYKTTGKYFDITVMPLVNLWGFGTKGFKKIPTEAEIAHAKSFVGMNHLKIRGNDLIKKKQGVSIDVNGIAQGYSVDVLSQFLVSRSVLNFIIELGGEIVAKGTKDGQPFIVEVQRPYQDTKHTAYLVQLRDRAITTSGTYEKQIKMNDKLVSHHINPKTGYPLENITLSATVIANTAMEADAIDNYLMFVSPQEAIDYANKRKDIAVYIVYIENNILKELQSSNFNNYIYTNR